MRRGVRVGSVAAGIAICLPMLTHTVHCFSQVSAALDLDGAHSRKSPPSWGLRYKPTTCPRLVGWAPRGCPLRRASPERSKLACGSGEEGRALESPLRKIGSWESFGADQRQNFTRAVWTCESPAQIFFTFDQEECHYIHEGKARVAIVSYSSSTPIVDDNFIEVNAGDCFITPAGARVCWDIVTPIKKQTSCREPFRMVAQGWILSPPLASCFSLPADNNEVEPNSRTLHRTSLLGEALQQSTHQSASALIDTLQESLSSSRGFRNNMS